MYQYYFTYKTKSIQPGSLLIQLSSVEISFCSKLSSFEQRMVFIRTNATATQIKNTHTLWNRSTIFWTLYCWTGLLEWYLVLVHDLPVVQICILNKILDNTNRLYNQLWRKIYLHNIPLMFAVAKDRSWQLHFYVTPYILHLILLARLYTWLDTIWQVQFHQSSEYHDHFKILYLSHVWQQL